MALSEAKVVAAADTLLAQGKYPSDNAVKEELARNGERGSDSTINKYMKQYRYLNKDRLEELQPFHYPLTEPDYQLFQLFTNTIALRVKDFAIDAKINEADEVIKQLLLEKQELKMQVASLTQTNNQLNDLFRSLGELPTKFDELSKQCSELESRLKRVEDERDMYKIKAELMAK